MTDSEIRNEIIRFCEKGCRTHDYATKAKLEAHFERLGSPVDDIDWFLENLVYEDKIRSLFSWFVYVKPKTVKSSRKKGRVS